jgi:hypothetical protein
VGDVERGVVRDEHGVAGELEEARQRLGERRCVGDHLVGDAGQLAHEGRDAPPGVHERDERLAEASRPGRARHRSR